MHCEIFGEVFQTWKYHRSRQDAVSQREMLVKQCSNTRKKNAFFLSHATILVLEHTEWRHFSAHHWRKLSTWVTLLSHAGYKRSAANHCANIWGLKYKLLPQNIAHCVQPEMIQTHHKRNTKRSKIFIKMIRRDENYVRNNRHGDVSVAHTFARTYSSVIVSQSPLLDHAARNWDENKVYATSINETLDRYGKTYAPRFFIKTIFDEEK